MASRFLTAWHAKLTRGTPPWTVVAFGFSVVVVLLTCQWRMGLNENEVFHIAGLYENLRSDALLPDVTRWNFRPLAYRLVMATLSVAPLNLLGWNATAMGAIAFSGGALVVAAFAGMLTDSQRRWAPRFWTAAVVAPFLLSFDSPAPWSADAVGGYVAALGCIWALRLRDDRLRWRALVLGLTGLVLFLVKGVTVLGMLPVVALAASLWGWRSTLRATLLGGGTALLMLLLAFPGEVQVLFEAAAMQGSHPVLRAKGIVETLLPPGPWPASLLRLALAAAAVWVSRRSWRSWLPCAVAFAAAGILVYVLQGKPWAYHAALLNGGLALGVGLALRSVKLDRRALLSLAAMVALSAGAAVLDRPPPSPPGTGRFATIPGIDANEPVLYLAYGTRGFATYGYPSACSYFSAHPLQRLGEAGIRERAQFARLNTYLDCVLAYDGRAVVWERKWLSEEKLGSSAILRKLQRDYRKTKDPLVWIRKE